ncbi:MAG: lysophospholipid acyltransferase family protein [Vulcanimicrobiaceae bacterium]
MTIGSLATRAIARFYAARDLTLRVEGLEHLPAEGPVLIAARHYHHLYDGAALVGALPRTVHLFVALDWTRNAWERRVMEELCRLADWPVALRGEGLARIRSGGFAQGEIARYVRTSLATGARLLREGRVLAVFPEGFPTIDPEGSRKPSDDAFLPFRPGFLAIVALAQRSGARIPIVPAGLAYTRGVRWQVALRFGAPLYLESESRRATLLEAVSARVKTLSAA